MTYPGGKNGSGVYQRIINHMPPHRAYVEAFCGSGAVLRNKRPAALNVAIDRSPQALSLCLDLGREQGLELQGDQYEVRLLEGDALALLPDLGPLGGLPLIERPDTLIYFDPPYLPETRKGGDLYDFELTEADHVRLLELITHAPCMVMLSGYRSALYDDRLTGWHRIDYQAVPRRGLVDEALWMNFPPPTALHDYSHLGSDFRERERIKRKKTRWMAKIARMDRQERLAIMDALTSMQGPP